MRKPRKPHLIAIHPKNGQKIEHGAIYVAPPDHHMLLLESGRIHLSHGPKENRTRPAINPLFRSAADTYRQAVTGVILTGNLDDGVLGLAEIKSKGGIAIAQHPKTAVCPSMPCNAIECVAVDYVVPVEDMPELLSFAVCREDARGMERHVEGHRSDLTRPEWRGPLCGRNY
jgi:two-component system, chemotaxis family, protein-glutamate methylesterase/glutaminase